MKTILSFFATILFSANSFSQSSAEVMCRAQAKEVAVQAYSNCITENNARVEEIIKSYKQELKDVKLKYDQKLKGLNGGAPAKVQTQVSPKPVKGVAKVLPKRAPLNGQAAPIQTISEGTKVVTVNVEEPSESLEKSTGSTEQPEFIDNPIE